MVRDPDIGTDQECFVCDGTGFLGYDDAGGSYEDNKLIWQKLGVSKADFEHLVELSL